ncbi:hypothetical protein [Streptacidiphilus albus]|uniref:hypothetical protein n=1 Tax=Streptacidiphilus albus TaxID=105425 RepID=UPI0005AA3BD1|nr:hypothetical protein [Streptacidiphilus albus]
MSLVKTDAGSVLQVTTPLADPVTWLSAVLTPGTTGSTPVATVTLQQSSPGLWQSAPLDLGTFGDYVYTIDATDAAGTHVAAPTIGNIDYNLSPWFHDIAGAPATLSYGHEILSVSGHVDTYNPNTGYTTTPYASASMSFDGSGFWSAADGSFSDSIGNAVGYNARPTTTSVQYSVGAFGADWTTVDSDPLTWAVAPVEQTRITLDHTSGAGLGVGKLLPITGVVQFQDTDGTWKPLADYPVQLGGSGFSYIQSATTNSSGRFTLDANVPTAPTTWGVDLPAGTYAADPYLAPSSATYQVVSVLQQLSLQLSNASIDQFSDLTFDQTVTSTNGRFPANRVYVLESPDGRTGWKNLGYIPVSGNTYGQAITAWVDNPHGYWLLYSPAGYGFAASYSNVVHTFRFQTAIVGGKPNRTTVAKNTSIVFQGTLYDRGYNPWTVFAHQQVDLFFRPYGSKSWYYMAHTTTDSHGRFSLWSKAVTGGTWQVVYLTGSVWDVDAAGPATYVHA